MLTKFSRSEPDGVKQCEVRKHKMCKKSEAPGVCAKFVVTDVEHGGSRKHFLKEQDACVYFKEKNKKYCQL